MCVRRNVACWDGKVVIHAAERSRLVVVQMLVGGSTEAGVTERQGVGSDRSGEKVVESP